MKRIISILTISLFCLAIPTMMNAQSESLRKFAKKYRNGSDVKKIKVGGWLVRLGVDFTNKPEVEQLRPLFKGLDAVQILMFDENVKPNADDVTKLVKGLREEKFEDLVSVRDGKDRVNLMIRTNKSGSKVYDLVIIVNEGKEGDAVIVGVEGEFKMSDIQKMIDKGALSFKN